MATSLPQDGSTVKLKGLPFKATVEDILEFLHDFTLTGDSVFLTRHPDGRPNGEAFIVFECPAEARRATTKDRHEFSPKFGDRYVRVYPTLESDLPDMQAAAAQQALSLQTGPSHSQAQWDSVVKIKSLPFDATQLDIIHFFEGFRLKPNGVQLVVRADYKPTGEAFVDFESPDEAARAIREKDHKVFAPKFGDRYVRLIQVSRKEMQATLALRFGGEGILKMKGIPFKAAAADVRKFFSNYKIKPDGISFIMHADGRPTGMAFIEFETPQEAVRAMEKDRAKFGPEYGDRFCMLQLVGRHEMDKVALQKESDVAAAPKNILNLMALQAAALAGATQAAALNPALQPLLMAQANPWLHMGLVNPATAALAAGAQLGQIQHALPPPAAPAVPPLLDPAVLAQLQMNSQIVTGNGLGAAAGIGAAGARNGLSNGIAPNALTGLNLLPSTQTMPSVTGSLAPALPALPPSLPPQLPATGAAGLQLDTSAPWLPSAAADTVSRLLYSGGIAGGQDWQRGDPLLGAQQLAHF